MPQKIQNFGNFDTEELKKYQEKDWKVFSENWLIFL